MIFSFILYEDTSEEINAALLNFVFYLLEKIRRYRLSKEGKNKADKKRQSVEETFLKTTHLQRQEAAQARREEKAKTEKQRMFFIINSTLVIVVGEIKFRFRTQFLKLISSLLRAQKTECPTYNFY